MRGCIQRTVLIMGLALSGPPIPPSPSSDVELVFGLTNTHTHAHIDQGDTRYTYIYTIFSGHM